MTRVGKYELVRKLATGGMAEVFLARFEWARGLEKTVVIKRILHHLAEDPSFIEMFFTEAQLAAQLSHPSIAQIIEFGENEGIYFLAMEYVDGPSLRALANAANAAGTGIPFPHCARITAFCCEALTYAHELRDAATGQPLNLVHRDVSPDNVLISKSGSVKLVDFGIAKAATQNHHTKTGLVKGKLAYMAPEQLRAEPLDCRADIFSLGVMLYELVAGRKPYEAPHEIALIHEMLYKEMVPLRARRPDVPPELEGIVNKALERNRDHRWASCREMHAALEKYLTSARQPVSVLQIAELVEEHRLAPSHAGPMSAQPMATPSRPQPQAKTPQPWHAERPPAAAAATQLQQPQLLTGSDARSIEPQASGVAAVAAQSPVAVPSPSILSPPSEPAVPGTANAWKRRASSWTLLAAAAMVLLALGVGVGIEASRRRSPEQPSQPARSEEKVPAAPMAATPAIAQHQPEQQPAPALSSKPTKEFPPRASRPSPATPSPSPTKPQAAHPPTKANAPSTIQPSPSSTEPIVQSPVSPTTVTKGPGSLATGGGSVAKQFGKVTFISRPASRVTVDGKPLGEMPLPEIELEVGSHTAILECDRRETQCDKVKEPTRTQTFEVKPGQTTTVKHFFQ